MKSHKTHALVAIITACYCHEYDKYMIGHENIKVIMIGPIFLTNNTSIMIGMVMNTSVVTGLPMNTRYAGAKVNLLTQHKWIYP